MTSERSLHLPSLAGTLPPGWLWKRLDDCCVGVFDCPHSTPELTVSGPYVARSQDVRTGVFRAAQAARVSESTYRDRVARAEPRWGDLLYSREGTYFGIAAEVPRNVKVCLGQRMVLIRPDPQQLNHRFLRYWLNSPVMEAHIEGHRDGSVAERLNLPTIRGLPICAPPMSVQTAIADVLGALDDKCELNQSIVDSLSIISRALFVSWFCDFDPVRSNMESRSAVGIDGATAALFPASFEDSDLGPIPRGWPVVSLEELVTLQRGTTYQSRLLGQAGPVLLGLGTILPGGGFRDERLKTYGGESPAKLLLQPGDIYVALKGATKDGSMVGSVARVPPSVLSGRLTQDTVKLELNEAKPGLNRYIYSALRTSRYREYCAQRATGSAQVGLSRADFLSYRIVRPPDDVLAAFARIDDSLNSRSDSSTAESATLASLRAALVPKLMSGELRVRDFERGAGGVA